jgi:hypothetical protein
MADIIKLSIVGDWRVVVQSKNAGWSQRIRMTGTAAGELVLAGVPGYALDVYGRDQVPWELHIEHDDGGGWQPSWVREVASSISAGHITRTIDSEDVTSPTSDRDFNDLVIRLEKLGMVAQASRPFAVHPTTLLPMPDGIFEASLGRYFMGVTARNVWTHTWLPNSRVGLTQRSRQWLAAAGVQVVDVWSQEDQAAFGQDVAGGRVLVGALEPWQTRLVYFKVDVTAAPPRKHQVEIEVAEPVSHLHRDARAPMMVTRTTWDADQGVFISECDRGRLVAAVRELGVDYNTLKRAVFRARKLFKEGGGAGGGTGPGGPGTGGGRPGCDRAEIERLRRDLLAFLKGAKVDPCEIWRRLQCCCATGGFGDGGGTGGDGTWTGGGGTGLEVLAVPTQVDYRVEYAPAFAGKFGPIPFDDPWWKIVLAIIALLLSLGAAASAAADLANHSDDVVIGEVTRSVLDDLVDAAVVTLNGNRSLSASIFSYLDAESGEDNVVPVTSLGGRIDTTGGTMTNAEITAAIAAFNANPTDPAALAGVRVFKSGARTGLTFGQMFAVQPSSRDDDDDGVSDRTFQNQVIIQQDPAFPNGVSDGGDSGSLWLHLDTRRVVALNHAGNRDNNTAIGSRIEDVMARLAIRFV